MKTSNINRKTGQGVEPSPAANPGRRTRLTVRVLVIWTAMLVVGSLGLGYLAWPWCRTAPESILTARSNGGTRLSSTSAWHNVRLFLAGKQGVTIISLDELKPTIDNTLTNGVRGHFAFYLDDLSTGEWLGIDEDNRFNAWSLLKVSVIVSVLRKVQHHQLSLDQEVQIRPEDIDSAPVVPSPMNNGGRKVSIRDLMDETIKLSDNTGSRTLGRLFTPQKFQSGLMGVGLPTTPPDAPPSQLPSVSPKQFANLLRSLYYSGYLKKPFCELILALLAETVYDSQIKMGLPDHIHVAHKVGFNASCGEFHDCGIVYLPGRPYILCVMSSGSTREESDRVISTVSRQVYEYMADAGQSLPKPQSDP